MSSYDAQVIEKLGPLGPLAGNWVGENGKDVAPADDRGREENNYREEISFEPTGLVENHEQTLYGLRYRTVAWRIGADDPFHEELGYWLWDATAKQVMRTFLVPRGISVIAGGTVEPDARSFELVATLGSETYGICSNQFLNEEFKTVRYDLKVTIHDDNSFSYDEDTQMAMKGRKDIFHHTDTHRLTRMS